MDLLTVVVLLIAITLIAVSVYVVTVCAEIKRTLFCTRELIKRIDTELVPLAHDIQELLTDLKVTSEGVASRVEDVKSAMQAVGDTGRNISKINAGITEVVDFVSRLSLLSTGFKAAGNYVCERISRKRG